MAGGLGVAAWSSGSSRSNAEKANDAVQKGLVAQKAGNLEAAEAFYREAMELDSRNAYALFDLGLIYHTRGDAVQAENFYRMAMSIDPNFTSPIYNMAVLRRDAGNLPEAITFYRRVIAAEPKHAAAHYNLGLVLRTVGQQAESDAELAKARQLDPNFGNVPASPTPNSSAIPPAPVLSVATPTPVR